MKKEFVYCDKCKKLVDKKQYHTVEINRITGNLKLKNINYDICFKCWAKFWKKLIK